MAAIQSIHVTIITASIPNAGTDGGCVYLGICGREFRVDSADHSFKTGSGKKYIFGQGANVSCPDLNDPRAPYPLWTDHLSSYPVYIRYSGNDLWCLEEVQVMVNPGPERLRYRALEGSARLWLGEKSGTFCYLRRWV